jgi:hypothetical protein
MKKNGSRRFCRDKSLNQKTSRDVFRMPLVEDVLM